MLLAAAASGQIIIVACGNWLLKPMRRGFSHSGAASTPPRATIRPSWKATVTKNQKPMGDFSPLREENAALLVSMALQRCKNRTTLQRTTNRAQFVQAVSKIRINLH